MYRMWFRSSLYVMCDVMTNPPVKPLNQVFHELPVEQRNIGNPGQEVILLHKQIPVCRWHNRVSKYLWTCFSATGSHDWLSLHPRWTLSPTVSSWSEESHPSVPSHYTPLLWASPGPSSRESPPQPGPGPPCRGQERGEDVGSDFVRLI